MVDLTRIADPAVLDESGSISLRRIGAGTGLNIQLLNFIRSDLDPDPG